MRGHVPPLSAAAVLAAILAADQTSKLVVAAHRNRLPVRLFGDIRLEDVHNTGVSFSLLSGHSWALTGLVAVMSIALVLALIAGPRHLAVPLATMLGGSLGNLVDRLRLGYVLDFVGIYTWPTFNVADVAIVAGAALLVLAIVRHRPAT